MTRKLSLIFRDGLEIFRRGENRFVCWALSELPDGEEASRACNHIRYLLGTRPPTVEEFEAGVHYDVPFHTVATWLQNYAGVNGLEMTTKVMFDYRCRWLEHIIEQLEKEGN